MRHKIITGNDYSSDIALDFIPTVIVGFFQAGGEDQFFAHYTSLKKRFPDVEVMGCNSESNITNEIPYVDLDGKNPCVFMLFEMKREAFSIQLFSTDETIEVEENKKYSAMMLVAEYNETIEETLVGIKHVIGTGSIYGAIAGQTIDSDGKVLLFYNGAFLEQGHLLWLIDNAYYKFKGMSIHNFEPVGMELNITNAKDKTIFEIEEEPALEIIESMMGTLTPESLASYDHPFFIWSEQNRYICNEVMPVTTLRRVNHSEKSLELFKGVHSGDKLSVAIPLDKKGQEKMFEKLIQNIEKDSVGFLFTCIAFKAHWGEMEPLYLMHLTQMSGLEFAGLHTFGEIGPHSPECSSAVQNQTLTLVTLNETR
ncbi:MAG: hypothetical protein DRG24_06245 [Epsilonproteobacteria bacterium]|nr:MAG: hypothetical protein DRG24_06245 [Campylobacterota bacterium]